MFDILFDIITSPGETFYRMSRRDLSYSGFGIMIGGIISTAAGVSLLLNLGSGLSGYLLTWGVLLRTFLGAFLLLILVSLYHFFAGIFGGEGSPGHLFKAIPYTWAPFVFFAPLILIMKAFFPKSDFFFTIPLVLLLSFFCLYLQYRLINYFYGLPFKNGVAAFITPWFIIIGGVAFFPILVLVSFSAFIV